MPDKRDLFYSFSQLFASNATFVEDVYEKYLEDDMSVDAKWREFFGEFGNDAPSNKLPSWKNYVEVGKNVSRETFLSSAVNHEDSTSVKFQRLKDAYRERGHFLAKLDPLNLEKNIGKENLRLNPEYFGLTTDSFSKVAKIEKIYCDDIGYEFIYTDSFEENNWLQNQIENFDSDFLDNKLKICILDDLIAVESFEQFLHTKFPGAKRFSIEGGENAVTAANTIVKLLARNGVEEVVFGMPHRGRLSVVTNVLKKPYKVVLSEFLGKFAHIEKLGLSGDVKYHLGNSHDLELDGKKIHLSLMSNPSHLEAINSVVLGKIRAKQDFISDKSRSRVGGVLFHGDASFAGQGVVMESLIMNDLSGYSVGGVIHVVINNQVGFTANTKDARSSRYSTDIAKLIKAPIFHVNGNSAEAIAKAAKIAVDYKLKFKKDVVIEIICYRLYGHNEIDEPRFTQPEMYKAISNMMTPATIYSEYLTKEGVIQDDYLSNAKEKSKSELEREFILANNYEAEQVDWFEGAWKGFVLFSSKNARDNNTGVSKKKLKELGAKITTIPADFTPHKIVAKVFERRAAAIASEENIDWGTGEYLAFASLLEEGVTIRLSGQDCQRGTFSHRHSVISDQDNYKKYIPLNNISDKQAHFEVINSPLSEYGVMGFEYGYSTTNPHNLVLWEAQFGDFANGAQIIVDQFLAAAEVKWMRCSGLVLLLPHGYEGQGPEHSSARLERYLQLCAENNMQVVNCTTPANYFHVLRRQMHRNYRKPLIVMSPKSLLRNPRAVSELKDFSTESFMPVIADQLSENATKLVICSGKVYYDLADAIEKSKDSSVAVIRIEEYYPFPTKELLKELKKYTSVKRVIWLQEEPKNMGAWVFVKDKISVLLSDAGIKKKLDYVGRLPSASTAAGHVYAHEKEHKKIISEVLN
jgi:2-oxoglutarate dehydrogenase E1 component